MRGSLTGKSVRRGQSLTVGAGNVSKSEFGQGRRGRTPKVSAGVAERDE